MTAVLVIFFSAVTVDCMCACNSSDVLVCTDDDDTTYVTMAFMVSFGYFVLHLAAQPYVSLTSSVGSTMASQGSALRRCNANSSKRSSIHLLGSISILRSAPQFFLTLHSISDSMDGRKCVSHFLGALGLAFPAAPTSLLR